jgi:hypothetical protein
MESATGKTCDYDTGTAFSGPSKCGKTARFLWDDPTARKVRPVCGIHARSIRTKFHGADELTPIKPAKEG